MAPDPDRRGLGHQGAARRRGRATSRPCQRQQAVRGGDRLPADGATGRLGQEPVRRTAERPLGGSGPERKPPLAAPGCNASPNGGSCGTSRARPGSSSSGARPSSSPKPSPSPGRRTRKGETCLTLLMLDVDAHKVGDLKNAMEFAGHLEGQLPPRLLRRDQHQRQRRPRLPHRGQDRLGGPRLQRRPQGAWMTGSRGCSPRRASSWTAWR